MKTNVTFFFFSCDCWLFQTQTLHVPLASAGECTLCFFLPASDGLGCSPCARAKKLGLGDVCLFSLSIMWSVVDSIALTGKWEMSNPICPR